MHTQHLWTYIVSAELTVILLLVVQPVLPTVSGSGLVDASSWLCDAPSSIEPESPLIEPAPEPQWTIRQPPLTVSRETLPRHLVRFNAQGFRDEPFTLTPEDNTTRIIVIGDSFTEGYGLNESQRYTEKLESRITADNNVEVLNAGLSGSGMQDYYAIFNRILAYNPDMVIVAFFDDDVEDRDRQDQWMADSQNKHGTRYGSQFMESIIEKRRAFYRNMTFRTSPIRLIGNRMQQVADRNSIDLVFYKMNGAGGRGLAGQHLNAPLQYNGKYYSSALTAWRLECNIRIAYAPDQVRQPRYAFNPDNHYNDAGNTVIANHLATLLTNGSADWSDVTAAGLNQSRNAAEWDAVLTVERYLRKVLAEEYYEAYSMLSPQAREAAPFDTWKREVVTARDQLEGSGWTDFTLVLVRLGRPLQRIEHQIHYTLHYSGDDTGTDVTGSVSVSRTEDGWRVREPLNPYRAR